MFDKIVLLLVALVLFSCSGPQEKLTEELILDSDVQAQHHQDNVLLDDGKNSIDFSNALTILDFHPSSQILDVSCFIDVTKAYPDFESEYFGAYFCETNPMNGNSFFGMSVNDYFIFITESKIVSSVEELQFYYQSISSIMSQSCDLNQEAGYDNVFDCQLDTGMILHVILEARMDQSSGIPSIFITYTYDLESYISLLHLVQQTLQ